MKSGKYALLIGILTMIFQVFSITSLAEVLELGASELHGKKDQPEAMTFISRAPVDKSSPVITWRARDKINKKLIVRFFCCQVKNRGMVICKR